MKIASQIEVYAKKLLQKIEPWLNEPAPFQTTQRICLSITGNTLSFLHADTANDEVAVLLNEDLEFDSADNLSTVLTNMVKRFHLEKIPTFWLLSPDDYQLFFIDALPVKSNEFQDALNWRLRSLISYPVQEAVIDYFMLPSKKTSTAQPMVVAVAARKQDLLKNTVVFENAGLSLASISIPELAMRNLTATYETDEKSTAFLYIYNNMAILNLTRQKLLHFTRRIAIAPNEKDAPNFYENMSLEILRYFDYFRSLWRYPSPTRFYIAAADGKTDTIISGLNKHLIMPLIPFPKPARLDNDALLSFGMLLQPEKKNVTAEH